ncbi:MAG TPA: PRC-barrel domain-containing protein [Bauldia sp.]|nr:PRC-barrel domain-containing protein [Bauldia sp.]
MNQISRDTTAKAGTGPSHPLIASDRVEGTNVYRPTGEKIGHIERIMIDKVSGKAAYAVMNFGGFLGLGEDSYPLPWSVLTYNPTLGGYEVAVTDEQLKGAPKYRSTEGWDDGNRDRDTLIYGYYGVPPYWM